jgi:hypothetical protein
MDVTDTRYYFRITPGNLGFITEINGGVRPLVHDEEGNNQYYVVNPNGKPNEIVSRADVVAMRDLVQYGTMIHFTEGLSL